MAVFHVKPTFTQVCKSWEAGPESAPQLEEAARPSRTSSDACTKLCQRRVRNCDLLQVRARNQGIRRASLELVFRVPGGDGAVREC